MNTNEMKKLTGAKYKMQAISILCERIERRNWKYNGDSASYAGYDFRKDLVHFCITKSVSPGTVSHRRIGVSMDDAIDCITGDIKPEQVTILH